METIKLGLDIKPLSVNEAWKGRRFKTKKYKSFELAVFWLLPNRDFGLKDQKLIIGFDFYFSNLNSDIDNPVKPILDILQKKYKFNDSQVYRIICEKHIVPKGSERISIHINKY